MIEYGLIGYPLEHSFSKKYFTEKFEREGLEAQYEHFPINTIYELKDLLAAHPRLKGLNVTVPYKQLVLQQLNTAGIPPGLHACNCIKIKEGKMFGFNTDITGFERSLLPLLRPHHKKALILGSGGAAEAARFVFEKNNIPYIIASRTSQGGDKISYADIDEKIIPHYNIIVNATPLGMYPDISGYPDIPYEAIGEQHLAYDMIYNPAKTAFLQKAEQQGATIKNGYEMLQLQAEESWKIWNGLF
jgi:shikimate dehydrogenase